MTHIRIAVDLDAETLAQDIVDAGGFDIEEFILEIDERISDEGFTIDLVKKLLRTLVEDTDSFLEYLAKMSLEQNFGGDLGTSYQRDYAKEWEREEKRIATMKTVIKLLEDL